jgi:glutathione synthase/RimK-type ligase-like ATP-grasp enzyme
MNIIFVVDRHNDWPFDIPDVEVVTARGYLSDPHYIECTGAKVFNLCNSYDYQTHGYYVSLLAEARGHRPLPDVKAIADLQSLLLIQLHSEKLDQVIQASLSSIDSDLYVMTAYFGQTADGRHEKLGEQLFTLLRMPLLQARFERSSARWHLRNVKAIALEEIASGGLGAVARFAADRVKGHKTRVRRPAAPKPKLAILHSPDCGSHASNPAAIQKFQEASESLNMRSEVMTEADAGRIMQSDALFIRDTTRINHYTYQLARQAAAAGMVVMDDADSILRCNNKMYLSELLRRYHIAIPKTLMVDHGNIDQVIAALGLPCILKQPDGAFSAGIEKIESEQELLLKAHQLFNTSELILAQEYLPTEFDWRIGVLDRKPLFACKYFMAPGHWQIIKRGHNQRSYEGAAEAVPLSAAPAAVVDMAVRAANLIGNGFYGVDLKQRGGQCYLIEINDNPNIDAGNEDGVLKEALYRTVMEVLRKRIEVRKGCLA